MTVDIPDAWDNIGGESAGLAFAAHFAATTEDYSLAEGVVATGVVNARGEVIDVNRVGIKNDFVRQSSEHDTIVIPPQSRDISADGVTVVEASTVGEAFDLLLTES